MSRDGEPGGTTPVAHAAHIRRQPFTLLALLTVLACAAVLWACGSPGSSSTNTGQANPSSFYGAPAKVSGTTATVDLVDNDFEPKNLQIKAGTKVTFDAVGHNQHDIVPDDPKKFDFTVPQEKIPTGAKVSFTFSEPGTYYYYCSLHATATAGDMRGVITVEP